MHPLKCASSFILKSEEKNLDLNLLRVSNEKAISRNPSKDINHLSEISAYWHSHVIIRRGLALKVLSKPLFLDYLIRNGCPG